MASFARRQKGNVTREQLLAAGFTRDVINRRVRVGSLHVMLPGVYLVGHQVQPPLARECAAVLYCAPRAMLSHRTAARLYSLPVPGFTHIEVTVVGRHRRSRPGLTVYSIGHIEPFEHQRYEGLPITSPSLTLLDLAGVVGEWELTRALNEARGEELINDEQLAATLRAHPNRRGARALAALVASETAEFVVESEAEARCLNLMIEYGLKPDASQARIGQYRVDFLYEAERLIVEVDGYRYHRQRSRFVRDRRRRAELLALGYEVFSVTWPDLTEAPETTMARLRQVLELRRELLRATASRV